MTVRSRSAARRGFQALEASAALVMALVAIGLIARSAAEVKRTTRDNTELEVARREADNALQRAALRSWDRLPLADELTEVGRAALADGRLELAVDRDEDEAVVTATVHWTDGYGNSRRVALSAWRHRDPSSEPSP